MLSKTREDRYIYEGEGVPMLMQVGRARVVR
jgi:hypothetical protein